MDGKASKFGADTPIMLPKGLVHQMSNAGQEAMYCPSSSLLLSSQCFSSR